MTGRVVAGCAKVTVFLTDDLPVALLEFGFEAGEKFDRVRLRAAVVHEHDFKVRIILGAQRRQSLGEKFRAVEMHEADADEWARFAGRRRFGVRSLRPSLMPLQPALNLPGGFRWTRRSDGFLERLLQRGRQRSGRAGIKNIFVIGGADEFRHAFALRGKNRNAERETAAHGQR